MQIGAHWYVIGLACICLYRKKFKGSSVEEKTGKSIYNHAQDFAICCFAGKRPSTTLRRNFIVRSDSSQAQTEMTFFALADVSNPQCKGPASV